MEEENLYAILDDELVCINDLNENDRHKNYTCPGCGCKMDIRLWRKNKEKYEHVGYFVHVGEHNHICNGETYKHEITKRLFKKYFDESGDVLVRINDVDKNLKEIYTESKVEGKVGKFKADVLLCGEDKKLLVEIVNTHSCSEEKINSGYEIIEFNVKNKRVEEIKEILTPGNNYIFIPDDIYGFKKKCVKPECVIKERDKNQPEVKTFSPLTDYTPKKNNIEITEILDDIEIAERLDDEGKFYYLVLKLNDEQMKIKTRFYRNGKNWGPIPGGYTKDIRNWADILWRKDAKIISRFRIGENGNRVTF